MIKACKGQKDLPVFALARCSQPSVLSTKGWSIAACSSNHTSTAEPYFLYLSPGRLSGKDGGGVVRLLAFSAVISLIVPVANFDIHGSTLPSGAHPARPMRTAFSSLRQALFERSKPFCWCGRPSGSGGRHMKGEHVKGTANATFQGAKKRALVFFLERKYPTLSKIYLYIHINTAHLASYG